MPGAVAIRGLFELQRAFALAGKETRTELRIELQRVAKPIRLDAERLAVETIPRIGPKWSVMRTGVTTKIVYVAPKQRGIKTRGPDPRKRPNLATLLMERALEPALERNRANTERALEEMLDRIGRHWERAA